MIIFWSFYPSNPKESSPNHNNSHFHKYSFLFTWTSHILTIITLHHDYSFLFEPMSNFDQSTHHQNWIFTPESIGIQQALYLLSLFTFSTRSKKSRILWKIKRTLRTDIQCMSSSTLFCDYFFRKTFQQRELKNSILMLLID